jgi:hypothetical protein
MKKKKIILDDWNGAYPTNWKGVIVDRAMEHPAKFSSKLIRRIYEHMRIEGWVKPGDWVLDPIRRRGARRAGRHANRVELVRQRARREIL